MNKRNDTHLKIGLTLVISIVFVLILAACGQGEAGGQDGADGKLKVVTTFTIIQDLAREIGGEDVVIHNLVPTGTDPHEYEPLPDDIKQITDADVLFYNGLNLEGGEEGWFFKTLRSIGKSEDKVYSLTERVTPMTIGGSDGHELEINPHAFIDPVVGIYMAEDMRDALIEVDPEREANYRQRADAYIERLSEIAAEYEQKIAAIPEERRLLVTSERAFQYMAARYGLEEAYIWEIDTEETGTHEQIKSLVDLVIARDVPVLFLESNVDPRPMETVSRESGVPIAEKRIFSDEIGQPGEEVDTYIKYLRYNINLIYEHLGQ